MGASGHSVASWRVGVARAVRALVVPAVVALPPLFWVADAARRASLTPLGRDQGIFQYIGWALTQGEVDYRDVRDVNGPLTHFIHRLFLGLGGADEHRFRVLDLVVTSLAFAFVGLCLPGLGRKRVGGGGYVDWLERLAWALGAWVVLGGQYLGYLYWDLAQRESFFDWFMLASVALQLTAQARLRGATDEATTRRQARLLGVVFALSVIPWLGKPTYALFTVAQLAAAAADRELALTLRQKLVAIVAGGAVGAASQLLVLFVYGDAGAYLRIALHDVPAMYRFIWPRTAEEILALPRFVTPAALGLVTGALMLGLVFLGQLPRRTLAVALLPACGLVSVIVQAKGFPYHFHPVTAGVALQWLVLLAWVSERARAAPRAQLVARVFPLALAAALALRVATEMGDSPHLRNAQLPYRGATPALRETPEYFALFPEPDFFPFEMRRAARYLREHTRPSDRVQTYGMDPYILFLAERRSATPYIYAYDLDADAALYGGSGAVPDAAQAAEIKALRDAHERDLLARVKRDPPAAFVFLDRSPLMTYTDAVYDFDQHCPDASAWVHETYVETATFGADHVWLRRDLANAESPE